MSDQKTFWDIPNVTFSQASGDGALPCALPNGPTPNQSGPDHPPASPLAWPDATLAQTIPDTSPLIFSNWCGRAAPLCCSGNKLPARKSSEALQKRLQEHLTARLHGRGSMMYRISWKPHTTPQGRVIYRLRASAHRTNAKGHFSGPMIYDLPQVGWGTPVAHEARLGYQRRRGDTKGTQKSLTTEVVDYLDPTRGDPALTGWPTPTAMERNASMETQKKRRDFRMKNAGQNTTPAYLNEVAKFTTDPQIVEAMGYEATTMEPARVTASGDLLTCSFAGMESGGQLNPEHSRWLMGYPAAWGFCGATAMQSIRGRRKSSSKRLNMPQRKQS